MRTLWSGTLILLLATGSLPGQDPGESTAEADRAARLTYLVDRLGSYALQPESGEAWKLEKTPLMRWQNAISGADGAVFLWSCEGRPQLIGKVHLNEKKSHYVESIVSLSPVKFTVLRGGVSLWAPASAGLTLQTVANVPAPADQEKARLIQMRAIARRYAITSIWGETDPSEWTLRLMPTPLHRYASQPSKVVDGALFGYAQGTNPEAVVLIEAVETPQGLEWRSGATRLTRYAVKALLDDETALDVPRIDTTRPDDTYRYLWEKLAEFPSGAN